LRRKKITCSQASKLTNWENHSYTAINYTLLSNPWGGAPHLIQPHFASFQQKCLEFFFVALVVRFRPAIVKVRYSHGPNPNHIPNPNPTNPNPTNPNPNPTNPNPWL